jgi:hypothetical protein
MTTTQQQLQLTPRRQLARPDEAPRSYDIVLSSATGLNNSVTLEFATTDDFELELARQAAQASGATQMEVSAHIHTRLRLRPDDRLRLAQHMVILLRRDIEAGLVTVDAAKAVLDLNTTRAPAVLKAVPSAAGDQRG